MKTIVILISTSLNLVSQYKKLIKYYFAQI